MQEIWKDIQGYEGLYQVSNLGRVKSLNRIVIKEYRGCRIHKERILKDYNVRGYRQIKLQKNKTKKNLFIHRLVAEAFIPNPNNYTEIDHIDCDKFNNKVSNLKWCNRLQNISCNNITRKRKNIKYIDCYDLNWNYLKTYISINQASKELNLVWSSIKQCCEGHPHHKRVGKYRFKFKEEI